MARSVSCADEERNRCCSLNVRLDSGGDKAASFHSPPSPPPPPADVSNSQPRLTHRLSLFGCIADLDLEGADDHGDRAMWPASV